jgi:hypothetical protein
VSKGLKYTFLFNAIALLLLGIGLLLFPNQLTGELSSATIDPDTRFSGASLLAIAIGSWLGYRASERKEVIIITTVQICINIFGLLAGLYTILFADKTSFVWGNIAFFVIFAILFIVFYPKEKKSK